MSEKSEQIVLFPYSTPDHDPAVDCLVLPVLDLYDVEVDVNFANQHVLALILLLSNLGDFNLYKRSKRISLLGATKDVCSAGSTDKITKRDHRPTA